MVWAAVQGERAEAIAARRHLTTATVYLWRHRVNEAGMAGLEDRPRSGRPHTYAPEQVGTIVVTARIPAETLRQPGTLPWYGAEYALDDFLVYAFYGHKREHAAQIVAMRDRLKE